MTKLKQLKYMLCLILALVCNVAWAETYTPVRQTTVPTDGCFLIYSESSSGSGWVHYDANQGRKYRVATDVDLSAGVTVEQAKYIWKLVNDSENGTFTLWNLGGNVYMPADASRNVNMSATTTANLALDEVVQGEGKWYLYQTNFTNSGNLLYIHTNAPEGYPNLSYWDSKSSDGTSIRAQFYKVGLPETSYTVNYMLEDVQLSTATFTYPTGFDVPEALVMSNIPAGYVVSNYTLSGTTYTVNLLNDIRPIPGKKYHIYCDNDSRQYFYNNNGSLAVSAEPSEEGNEYVFVCSFDGNYFQFKNLNGKYLAHKSLSDNAYNFEIREYVYNSERRLALFAVGANKYFVMKNDGSFDQADATFHAETTDFSTSYKFEEVISKYAFPENGKTYYIYSDTYHNNAFVNRFLYADGASLKMNTALSLNDNYKWTCTVNNDGSMTFQNGAGKYLGHKTMADAPYNFTVANTSVHNKNAVTLYAKDASRYVVVHNDGTQFNQSTATYNQETDAYCTDFVFIEADNVHLLSVNGDSKVKATATWNNVTKVLPASWMVFKGDKINNPTLTVTPEAAYSLDGLYSGDVNNGKTMDITSLEDNLELTARYSPAFFSTIYGEKWVNVLRKVDAAHAMFLSSGVAETQPTFNKKDYTNTGMMWCFVGTANEFKIYSYLSETLALTPSAESIGNGTEVKMVAAADAQLWKLVEKDGGYAILPVGNNSHSLNSFGGTDYLGGPVKFWGADDGGSHWNVDIVDAENILTMGVSVDKVWESSPRVAELTFAVDGVQVQTRITESVGEAKYYLPKGVNLSLSSMTYRGYTFNGIDGVDNLESFGIPQGGLELNVSYTANDERTLFYTPRDGHPYRIPAIATAPNGDIFAICDYRPCGNDIGYGEVDLVCRVSSDNGVTWTEEKIIADGKGDSYAEGDASKIWQVGFGDPAIVADRERNEVLVMSVCGNQTCWDGTYGEDNENPNRVARIRITHDGEKWVYGDPEEVTYSVYPKFKDEEGNVHAASLFIGAGKICQSRVVKKGDYYRLYCAVWTVTMTQRQHHNYVIYSDDFGKTWNVLGDLGYENSASKWGNEPKVEELPDGTVVLSSRKYNGRYFNLFTFADDTYTTGSWMGEVGSNEVQGGLSFGGNSTNGEIYKVKAIHKESGRICDLMFQSIPTGGGRDNVAIYYKEMEYNEDGTNKYTSTTFAQGWTKGIHVSTKGSCYSTMISQADGRIAFFFEEEPSGYCMVYIPYTIEELTGGAYTLYTVNSTIGEKKIGTFYASEAMQIPEGIKAYVATEAPVMNEGVGVITMQELEGIIPAKTGAVLRGEADDYKFIPSISYGTPVDGNMLVGYEGADNKADSQSAVTLPEGSTVYVLAVENEVAGFYKKDAGFNVYNNKAYLQVPGSAGARAIYFDFGGETGILETENGKVKTENIYDLSGRRVVKAQKGVYIVNGELKVVK